MSLSSVTKEFLQVFLQTRVAKVLGTGPYLTLFAAGYAILLMRNNRWFQQPRDSRVDNPNRSWPRMLPALRNFLLGPGEPERSPWDAFLRSCILVLALYLLLGNPWFWPWYLIWPIALISLHQDRRMVAIMIVVACTAMLSHVLWNFVWYWLGTSWKNLYIVDILAFGLMLVPALVVYAELRRRRKSALMHKMGISN
jgi:hypothetical protein